MPTLNWYVKLLSLDNGTARAMTKAEAAEACFAWAWWNG